MKACASILAASLFLVSGCSTSSRNTGGPPVEPVGAPTHPVDPTLAGTAIGRAAPEPVELPERIVLPASYRLMILDGHMALVRETDGRSIEAAPSSLRVIAGEIAKGELAYQPALLAQELASEVAANRESSARMDNALEEVMKRSRELSGQALEVQVQSSKLAELLTTAEARIRQLEATSAPVSANPSLAKPDADKSQQ
jgi:hypothetical protein